MRFTMTRDQLLSPLQLVSGAVEKDNFTNFVQCFDGC